MPWVANNNQAGDIRAPALSTALRLKKQQEQHQKRVWSQSLRAISLEDVVSIDRDTNRGCALLHPTDFPAQFDDSNSSNNSIEFIYPRVHAQFVVAVRSCDKVPKGCVALAQPQLINLELCIGQVETWSLFQDRVPVIHSLAIEIRPLVSSSSAFQSSLSTITVDAQTFAMAFSKAMWRRILTENERISFTYNDNIEYFVRVVEIDAEDESETEFTMPDSFRGVVDEETTVFVSVDGCDELVASYFQLVNQVDRPVDQSLTAMRSDVVVVITNDEEEFPVKKKLLFPCIKLSSAVLSGRGVHKDASSTITVDVDCLTFDRLLLYLEHEARGEDLDFQFDPQYTDDLLTAAKRVGCIGLEEVCKKRLGEFDTRVRKEAIPWDEVVRHNNSGDIWLCMQGMVFDVTRWLPEHPGGSVIIPREAVNVDCTVMFEIYHSSRQSFRYLKQFYIGEIAPLELSSVPMSNEQPSAAFLEEFQEYTTWRITPEVPTFKSF